MNFKCSLKDFLKLSFCFAIISFGFSIIGTVPDNEHAYIVGNPFEHNSVTIQHVLGHILWGAIIGLGAFSIRYVILGGSFAILLDADHLLQFLDIEMIARFSHSIPFAIIVAIAFYFIFSKRDIILSAVCFSAVLSHLAFDIFLADIAMQTSTNFPLLAPIIFDDFTFEGIIWLYIQIIAVVIVITATIINKKRKFEKMIK